jgi:hypothetical protein
MAENEFTAPITPAVDKALIAASNDQITGGARWFWWIAGLSLVNTVLLHSGSDTSFVIGLGFTLLADAIFQSLKPVAFAIDALAIGAIFALGWFAGKGHAWAFITGIVLYALDALIYVTMQSWMSVGFHVFALFFIGRGLMQLRADLKAAREAPPPEIAPVTPVP